MKSLATAVAIGALAILVPASAAGRTKPITVDSLAWAPNGSIALSSGALHGRQGLFVVSPSGGRPLRVAPSGSEPRWMRSGLLAFDLSSGIYTVGRDGRGLRRVRRNGFLLDASPVGDRLLYLTLAGDLRLIRSDGSRDEHLTWLHLEAPSAAFSPDGRSIAFFDCRVPGSRACEHSDAWDVYTLRLGGPNRRKRVTRSPLGMNCLRWAPGPKIAFEGEHGVYVGNRLVIPHAECPSWSPDGRWLAASAERTVIVAHGDGSKAHRAVRLPRRSFSVPSAPVWSPDSRRIAFGWPVGRGPIFHLFTALASGGGLQRLT